MPEERLAVDPPTPTQDEADAFKDAAHGTPADPPTGPPVNIDVPVINGPGTVGAELSVTMGNWNNEPTSYAGEWFSDGTSVGTGTKYTPQATGSVTCIVTATNSFGSTAAPPSNAIMVV
jgi:hypothetical protein